MQVCFSLKTLVIMSFCGLGQQSQAESHKIIG